MAEAIALPKDRAPCWTMNSVAGRRSWECTHRPRMQSKPEAGLDVLGFADTHVLFRTFTGCGLGR